MIDLIYTDNMKYMATLPDGAFDLLMADPPYGINAPAMDMGNAPARPRGDQGSGPSISTAVKLRGRLNSGAGTLKDRSLNKFTIDWDNEIPPPEYFKEVFRVTKHQIIFGGNYFPLPPTRGIIVWDKKQPWDNFSQVELIWTSFDFPAAIVRISNTGGNNLEPKIHPTQKPVSLYKWLLTKRALPGWKILDTGFGSAASAIAAHDLGFDYVGLENNIKHYEEGTARACKFINTRPPQLNFK